MYSASLVYNLFVECSIWVRAALQGPGTHLARWKVENSVIVQFQWDYSGELNSSYLQHSINRASYCRLEKLCPPDGRKVRMRMEESVAYFQVCLVELETNLCKD